MSERRFDIRFEVWCTASADVPEPLHGLVRDAGVRWRWRDAGDEDVLPAYGRVPGTDRPVELGGDEVTRPVLRRVLREVRARTAKVCVVECRRDDDDLTPLQMAMGLVSAVARTTGRVVIDRTADLGYAAEEFIALERALNQDGDFSVRDGVVIEIDEADGRLALCTIGMSKYGHPELLIEGFPREARQAAVSFCYDHLAQHGAEEPFVDGQIVRYKRTDPAARLVFTQVERGLLRVSDYDPTTRRPLPGVAKLCAVMLPSAVTARALARSPTAHRVTSLEDYVTVLKLMQAGRMQHALWRYELTPETLGGVTEEWMRRLDDPQTARAFADAMSG